MTTEGYTQPRSVNRTHVPELEQWAENQRPKSIEHAERKLFRYDGTDLYQWWTRTVSSVFFDPYSEPFVIEALAAAPEPLRLSEEVVEKAARAIARQKRGPACTDADVERVWHSYVGQARAALGTITSTGSGGRDDVMALARKVHVALKAEPCVYETEVAAQIMALPKAYQDAIRFVSSDEFGVISSRDLGETPAAQEAADGGWSSVQRWAGRELSCLSVPGADDEGKQLIDAHFQDGLQITVTANTINEAWREMEKACEGTRSAGGKTGAP